MLNAFQKKVAGWATTCFSFAVIAAFVVLIFEVLAAFLDKFSSVVWPLALAAILAIILRPAVDFLSKKLHISLCFSTILAFALTLGGLAIILFFAIPIFIEQMSLLGTSIPDGITNAAKFLTEKFPDLKESIQQHLGELKTAATAAVSFETITKSLGGIFKTAMAATGSAVHFCAFAAAFAVAPIYLFYILSTRFDFYNFIDRNLKFCSPQLRETIVFFTRRFAEILTTFFRGQLTIAVIMGILYGIGLTVVGVKFGFVIGFFTGLLNLVPYLGTMIGLGIIIPVASFQDGGGLLTVALALGVFAAVQALEGYFLTPKIMGDRTGLHPTVIIFSVFFWGVALDGIIGMILAIPLTAFVVALYRGRKEANKGLQSVSEKIPADNVNLEKPKN